MMFPLLWGRAADALAAEADEARRKLDGSYAALRSAKREARALQEALAALTGHIGNLRAEEGTLQETVRELQAGKVGGPCASMQAPLLWRVDFLTGKRQ
jgi:chromosome segregation ATPase